MDTKTLEGIAFEACRNSWARFSRIYTLPGTCPDIIINARLKTTAGRCDLDKRLIDLSPLLFAEHIGEFERVIIPHEVAHQVAWDVYKDGGHGPNWKRVMNSIGLPGERCHSLTSRVIESARENNTRRKIRQIANQFVVGDTASFEHTDRQKNTRTVTGTVVRVNVKTISMVERGTGAKWRVPFENTCNLRHA